MRKLFLILWCTTVPAHGIDAKPVAFVIDSDLGGAMRPYYEQAAIMRDTQVVIDGPCLSACTLYLRRDFGLQVCMTHRAVFGFHMPYYANSEGVPEQGGIAELRAFKEWDDEFYKWMPTGIRMMLDNAEVPSPSSGDSVGLFHLIPAAALVGIVPMCSGGWRQNYTHVSTNTVGIGPQ